MITGSVRHASVSAPAISDVPKLQRDDEQREAEQAVDDRRHAGHVRDREPDDARARARLGVLGEVDARADADGHGERPRSRA